MMRTYRIVILRRNSVLSLGKQEKLGNADDGSVRVSQDSRIEPNVLLVFWDIGREASEYVEIINLLSDSNRVDASTLMPHLKVTANILC